MYSTNIYVEGNISSGKSTLVDWLKLLSIVDKVFQVYNTEKIKSRKILPSISTSLEVYFLSEWSLNLLP